MPPTNLRAIGALVDDLEANGVTRNPEVDRGLAVGARVQAAAGGRLIEIVGPVRDFSDDRVRDVLIAFAVTYGPTPLDPGITALQNALTAECVDLLTADVPRILDQMRPRFDDAAAAAYTAAQAGIRAGMTADDVIDLGDTAIAAWRALPRHLNILDTIAGVRIKISEVLGIPPAQDFTAAFTAPDAEITTGHAEGRAPEWLALARATGYRLRLNDPAEVDALLDEGDSPGWVVSAAGAVVRSAAGSDLHLYRGDWLPTWLDDEQVARLVDMGMVTPARAGTVHPGDKYPPGEPAAYAETAGRR